MRFDTELLNRLVKIEHPAVNGMFFKRITGGDMAALLSKEMDTAEENIAALSKSIVDKDGKLAFATAEECKEFFDDLPDQFLHEMMYLFNQSRDATYPEAVSLPLSTGASK